MTAVSLASLLVVETKAAIYRTGLAVANAIGLPVSSWTAGDPTRALFHLEAETLSQLEVIVAGFIQSGFLDHATGDWLKILAKQVFNVEVPGATYAATEVTLTNAGGAVYEFEAGDITLKSTTSGKTYRNTSGGTLAGLSTLDVDVVADEAGSESSAGAGEIDDLVTVYGGVTCSNATAAIGVDEQGEETTIQQCRDKLGSLSPNGPREAYSYVARNAELSGTNAVTRVRVYGDSDTGDVSIYLAGSSGGVIEADRDLVEEAILQYATPICITPTIYAAADIAVPVTYEIWVYKSANRSAEEIEDDVLLALEKLFANHPIGGDRLTPTTAGALYLSLIESTIRGVYPQAFRASVSSPSDDVALTNGQVATLGTVTANVHLVSNP